MNETEQWLAEGKSILRLAEDGTRYWQHPEKMDGMGKENWTVDYNYPYTSAHVLPAARAIEAIIHALVDLGKENVGLAVLQHTSRVGQLMTEVGTLTLAEFLLARIAADETIIRDGDRVGVQYPSTHMVDFGAARDDEQIGAYMARFDPERLLAECEAKRRIVEMHVATEQAVATIAPLDDVIGDAISWSALAVTTAVLQQFALSYAAHPHYREEWRP